MPEHSPRHAALFRYRIPLTNSAVLRDATPEMRIGLILQLTDKDREGWGEAAPLPGFSHESLQEAERELRKAVEDWLKNIAPSRSLCPAAAFALSCAQAELENTLPEAMHTKSAALYDGNDFDTFIAQLQASPKTRLVKLKLGRNSPTQDAAQIEQISNLFPSLRLRLDANRAYTLDDALRFAEAVAPFLRARIDFVEEPCAAREDSRAFAQQTGIAIAWDESVREPDFKLEAEPGVAAIIVKPTLTGSLARCRTLCETAHQQGLTAVISASIESTLALTQLARIAAWLTPETTPGLDTANLLHAQVLRRWPGCTKPLLTMNDLELLWRC